MAHEVDGNGNIKVFTFCVTARYSNGDVDSSTTFQTVDYVDGWNTARRLKSEMEGADPDYGTDDENDVSISIEWEWVNQDEWEESNGEE